MSKTRKKIKALKKPIPIILGVIFALLIFGAIILLAKPHNNALKNLYNNSAEIKAEYKLAGMTFVKEAEDANGIKAIIGEEKAADFEPSITLTKWEDEVKFSVKPDISDVAKADRTLQFDKNKIVFNTPKIEYRIYDLPKTEGMEQGGYEFEIILKEKPASNVVSLNIETQNLDFFYQPPLNQEKHRPDIVSCTETQCFDKDGKVASQRPENVVGSYAVYYKDGKSGDYTALGGKNYRAGKAFHIYRPKIIDSAGTEVWGILNINKEAEILSVEIPQSFLDSAIYPIHHAAGLTIGNIGTGASETAESMNWGGQTASARGQAAFSGTASKISLYMKVSGSSGPYKMGFYSDKAGPYPDARIGYDSTGINPTNTDYAWVDSNAISGTITAGAYYWAAWNRSTFDGMNLWHRYDTETDGMKYKEVSPYNQLDDPYPAAASSYNEKISIYITYTEASELKHTVAPAGTSPTPDFNTLAAAAAHLQGLNLVTANQYATIEIYGDWSGGADTAAVTLPPDVGIVTDATHYVHIYTTGLAARTSASPARIDTTKYVLSVSNTTALYLRLTNYVKIDGLQITTQAVNANGQGVIFVYSEGAGHIDISNCIIKGSNSATYYQEGLTWQSAATFNIWNCIFYNFDTTSNTRVIGTASPNTNIYSTTVIGGYYGILDNGGGAIEKNNYVGGCGAGGCYYGGTKTTCASSDTSGTAGLQNIAANTTQFVNVTAGSENFHLAGTGSALYNVGTDTTGDAAPLNFTTDIDGETRDATWDIGADAAVTSLLKHTVTPAGQGGDFNTLADAIAHLVAAHTDLVSLDVYATIEIDGDWTGVSDTAAVTISGLTTDATHYLYIYTTAAARHAGVWSTSKYNLSVSNVIALDIEQDYVRIDGLQVSQTPNSYDQHVIYAYRAICWISNCIIKAGKNNDHRQAGVFSYLDSEIYIWNCIIYNFGNASSDYNSAIVIEGTESYPATGNVYNSTLIGGVHGLTGFYVTLTAKNVYARGSGVAYSGVDTMVTCASSDTSGSTGLQNIAVNTDTFVNVSAGTEDFHLAADGLSPLQGAGTDTSGDAAPMNFTTDIGGQTRSGTWDIGADEYGAAKGWQIKNGTIKIKHGTVKIK